MRFLPKTSTQILTSLHIIFLLFLIYISSVWGRDLFVFMSFFMLPILIIILLIDTVFFAVSLFRRRFIAAFVPILLLISATSYLFIFSYSVFRYTADWKFHHYRKDYEHVATLVIENRLPRDMSGRWSDIYPKYALPAEYKHLTINGYVNKEDNGFYKGVSFLMRDGFPDSFSKIVYAPGECATPEKYYEFCLDKNWFWHEEF